MKFTTALVMNAASLAAFVVAKRLLSDEPGIDTAPSPLRAPLTSARTRLLRARARAQAAVEEGRAERDAVERALLDDYRRRAGWPRR